MNICREEIRTFLRLHSAEMHQYEVKIVPAIAYITPKIMQDTFCHRDECEPIDRKMESQTIQNRRLIVGHVEWANMSGPRLGALSNNR